MDFGVYSLVDVLVCKDSENRAKCKINRDLFSFLMEHQGQVMCFIERYFFYFNRFLPLLSSNTCICWMAIWLTHPLEFDGISNCTEFNTIEIGIV